MVTSDDSTEFTFALINYHNWYCCYDYPSKTILKKSLLMPVKEEHNQDINFVTLIDSSL